MIIKGGTRPRQDRESHAFSLETETGTCRDLNKFCRFSIFDDENRPETSGKMYKQTSPIPRLINNQNWSETETRTRVSVPFVSKPRRDRESRQSVVYQVSLSTEISSKLSKVGYLSLITLFDMLCSGS